MSTPTRFLALAPFLVSASAFAQTPGAPPFQGTITARAGDDDTTLDFHVGPSAVRIDVREEGEKKVRAIFDTRRRQMTVRFSEHNVTLRFPLPRIDIDSDDADDPYERTGRFAVVAGVKCEWFHVHRRDKPDADACVTSEFGPLPALVRSLPDSKSWSTAMLGGKQFPLEVIEHGDEGDSVEWRVTRIERKALDPSTFSVPTKPRFSLGFDIDDDT